MKSEKFVSESAEYSVNVAGGRCEAFRVKKDKRTAVRVFDRGFIGIAAAIGGEEGLIDEAVKKIENKITYPCLMPVGKVRSESANPEFFPSEDIVRRSKSLLSKLQSDYPDFIFSDKLMTMGEGKWEYSNSEGTNYTYSSRTLAVGCVIKAKSSANIMDGSYFASRDYYDEDEVASDFGVILNPYDKTVSLPAKDLPVIISHSVFYHLLSDLIAEKYLSGASLFSGKLGKRLFNEKVSLYADYSPKNEFGAPFFDSEGTTVEGDRFYFVKGGVLTGLATYRRSASAFNLPLSGGALTEFDEVPHASFAVLNSDATAAKLTDIVKGKAIFVAETSGGDVTPDGNLGLPVQLAYLYDDGRLVGRLPEFGIGGSVFDVLGKDFIGAADNDLFKYKKERVLVSSFKINE